MRGQSSDFLATSWDELAWIGKKSFYMFLFSNDISLQIKTAATTSTLAVYAFVIILCLFLWSSLENNKMKRSHSPFRATLNFRRFLEALTLPRELLWFQKKIGNRTSCRPIRSLLTNWTFATRSSDLVIHLYDYSGTELDSTQSYYHYDWFRAYL